MAHIFNIDGQTINPATEEKQDDIISALGGGDAVELATEDKQDDIIDKMITAPATEAKQDDLIAAIGGDTDSLVRKSSGLTPIATTTDAAVTAIAADAANDINQVIFANEGTVAGFFSIDSGTTWHRLPSEHVTTIGNVLISNKNIQVKRVAGGSDLSDIYVEAF
jgi:hypothetical protein